MIRLLKNKLQFNSSGRGASNNHRNHGSTIRYAKCALVVAVPSNRFGTCTGHHASNNHHQPRYNQHPVRLAGLK